jgi:hypothetical protein
MGGRAFFQSVLFIALSFGTNGSAVAADCLGVANADAVAVSRDEGMMISACEYRSDCSVKAGSKIGFRAIVVLPAYDIKNLFLMDEKGRCFVSRDFDFEDECNAPVRVNEGCEP